MQLLDQKEEMMQLDMDPQDQDQRAEFKWFMMEVDTAVSVVNSLLPPLSRLTPSPTAPAGNMTMPSLAIQPRWWGLVYVATATTLTPCCSNRR